jgi:hypothetical protein
MLSVAIFTVGCGTKPQAQDTKTPDLPLPLGIIDMAKAVKAHPKYQEVESLQQQLDILTAQSQTKQQTQANQSEANVSTGGTVDAGLNTALEQEFKAKMDAKQAELTAGLRTKADQLRSDLTAELKTYSDEVDKEYQPQIFSLQLKLKTVKLDKEEMAALQSQLDTLQKERTTKLSAKEQEQAAHMDAVMAPEQAAAEQQMKAYSQQLNTELSQKAAAKTAEITARNITPQPQPADSSAEQQLTAKRQEIDTLEQAIVQDVTDKVGKIASEKGIDTVITGVAVNVNATDITDLVIAECKK